MATRYQRQVTPDAGPQGGGLEAMSIADSLNRFDEKVRPVIDTLQFNQQAPGIRQEIAAGGDYQPDLGITPLQKARNEVAQRAYLDRTKLDIQAEFANLSAKYQGHAPDDAENFARELDAYAGPKLSGIPEQFRGAAEQFYAAERGQAVAGLKERAAAQAFQNDIRDIKAAADADAEVLMKAARDGDAGAIERATVSIHGRYNDLVTKGVMGEQEALAEAGKLVEGVRAESLYGAFLRGSGPSLQDVEAGRGEAASLSLDARDALARQMQAELAHRRSEQNHAIAVGEKMRAQGDRDLNALTRKLDLGIPLTPDEQARMTGYSTGALPASPVQIEEARAAHAGLTINREVATATPEQIAATRGQWAANPPASIEEALIREKATKAFDARERALKEDPMAYAQAVLPDKYPTIALPSNPASPEFDQALSAMSDQADMIRAQFGVDALPLTKPDQQRLATMIATLPADQKAAVRGKIEANMGPNAMHVWESLGKEGATVAAHAGILAAQGRGDLASSIEQGQQALASGVVKITPAQYGAELIGSGIAEAYSYSPQAQAQLRDAALARAAYLATMAGKPEDAADYLKDAQKDVAGAVEEYQGKKIALPLGLDDVGEFADRIESVDPTDAAKMGWPAGVAEALAAGEARLTSVGEGRYLVTIGNTRVMDAKGRPFELNYAAIPAKSPVVKSWSFPSGEPLIRTAVR